MSDAIDLAEVLLGLLASGDEHAIVVDSGTECIIGRDRDMFLSDPKDVVRIKGANGLSTAYKGILKPCELGAGLPAIYFPACPVPMLLSTEGMLQIGWETHFCTDGRYLLHRRSGTVLSINKGTSGLPTMKLAFGKDAEDDEVCGTYVCTPCVDDDNNDDPPPSIILAIQEENSEAVDISGNQ